MGIYGADTAQLRELAKAMLQGSERLAAVKGQLGTAVVRSPWRGPDAQSFREDWRSGHSQVLASAISILELKANVLLANAQEQETASRASGGGPGASGGERSTADRDRPGSPDPKGLEGYEPLPDDIPLDDDALDPSNMEQGSIGDCWLLAALGAVAKDDPGFIRDHMWENPDGTWTVKMYKDGEPVYIQVEPSVVKLGAKGANGTANWLSVYEKAAAEYYGGSYDDIDGGHSSDAFEAITGQGADKTGDVGLDELRDRLADGPVALGTEVSGTWWPLDDEVDDNRIVPSHAYIVDRVEERNGQTMIHVLNPWGPDGGKYDGHQRSGDLWLTEDEYKENFATVYSAPSTKD